MNVCIQIDCPYVNPDAGCQRFHVATACPLQKQFSGLAQPPQASQYFLYGKLTDQELQEAKQSIESWLLQDNGYKNALKAQGRWGKDTVKYPTRAI